MATTSASRLSPQNIDDDILRVELYREIIESAAQTPVDWIEYEIQPDERLLPELVAHRVYEGTPGLRWVVERVAGIDDRRSEIPVGKTIFLPPVTWIRKKIKYWTEFAEGFNA